MKRILASLLIAFAVIPAAFADTEMEELELENPNEMEEEWTVEDFQKERELTIAELEFELTYYVEDEALASSLKAQLPGMQNLEEEAFFEQVDAMYDQIDAHYESMGWFDDEEWEDEDDWYEDCDHDDDWEDDSDWFEDEEEDDDDEFDSMNDEQALVELITQVIMQLKAQGLI